MVTCGKKLHTLSVVSCARSHFTDSDFTELVHPGRPFKWGQDSWQWWPLPFTLTSLPPASSLTSCCHASAIHISSRIQQGVSGSRLGLSINKSKQMGNGVAGVDTELTARTCAFFSPTNVCLFYDPCTSKLNSIKFQNDLKISIYSWKPRLVLIPATENQLTWGNGITNRERKHLRGLRTAGESIHLWRAELYLSRVSDQTLTSKGFLISKKGPNSQDCPNLFGVQRRSHRYWCLQVFISHSKFAWGLLNEGSRDKPLQPNELC